MKRYQVWEKVAQERQFQGRGHGSVGDNPAWLIFKASTWLGGSLWSPFALQGPSRCFVRGNGGTAIKNVSGHASAASSKGRTTLGGNISHF